MISHYSLFKHQITSFINMSNFENSSDSNSPTTYTLYQIIKKHENIWFEHIINFNRASCDIKYFYSKFIFKKNN